MGPQGYSGNTPILRIGNVYGLPYNYVPTVELSVIGYTYTFDFGIPTISGYIFNSNFGSGCGQGQQGIQGIQGIKGDQRIQGISGPMGI